MNRMVRKEEKERRVMDNKIQIATADVIKCEFVKHKTRYESANVECGKE